MNEVIIKGKPNTGLPSISAWCAKGQTAGVRRGLFHLCTGAQRTSRPSVCREELE